jgi:hypothetical protein
MGVDERLLHWVQIGPGEKALNGGDLLVSDLADKDEA